MSKRLVSILVLEVDSTSCEVNEDLQTKALRYLFVAHNLVFVLPHLDCSRESKCC